jgi:hypothetical protein
MSHQALLGTHVVLAAIALLLGLGAMSARKRRGGHTNVGQAYFAAVSAVSISGGALAILDWERNAPFLAIAILTQSLAVLGWVAGGRAGRRWLMAHAAGMVGSYVEIAGAFLVNNWVHITGRHGIRSPEAFILPGAVGSVVLIWLLTGIHRGRLPNPRPRARGDR